MSATTESTVTEEVDTEYAMAIEEAKNFISNTREEIDGLLKLAPQAFCEEMPMVVEDRLSDCTDLAIFMFQDDDGTVAAITASVDAVLEHAERVLIGKVRGIKAEITAMTKADCATMEELYTLLSIMADYGEAGKALMSLHIANRDGV